MLTWTLYSLYNKTTSWSRQENIRRFILCILFQLDMLSCLLLLLKKKWSTKMEQTSDEIIWSNIVTSLYVNAIIHFGHGFFDRDKLRIIRLQTQDDIIVVWTLIPPFVMDTQFIISTLGCTHDTSQVYKSMACVLNSNMWSRFFSCCHSCQRQSRVGAFTVATWSFICGHYCRYTV